MGGVDHQLAAECTCKRRVPPSQSNEWWQAGKKPMTLNIWFTFLFLAVCVGSLVKSMTPFESSFAYWSGECRWMTNGHINDKRLRRDLRGEAVHISYLSARRRFHSFENCFVVGDIPARPAIFICLASGATFDLFELWTIDRSRPRGWSIVLFDPGHRFLPPSPLTVNYERRTV